MNKYTGIITALLMGLSLTLGGMSDADAKRFGGGSSFGSRPSYSAPYQRSATPAPRPANQQQAADAPNPAAKPGWAGRPGLMGMLGGLALGGLLGSMFHGGGFQGINFMDMLIFGGIAFLLYKLFVAKKAGAAQRPAYNRTADNSYQDTASSYHEPEPAQANPVGFDTDILFKKDKNATPSYAQPVQQDAGFASAVVPKDFDQQAFLSGAKIAFANLQKAWDERDFAEIRGLTTDKVFAEIQDQLKASTTENRTEILKLEAELLEFREVGSELEAVVLFDTIMREDGDAQAGQVREVWHFIKPKVSIQPKWYLDGIQQLAD
jgi:predicted lipid-binding transport protein (Tim44 family)